MIKDIIKITIGIILVIIGLLGGLFPIIPGFIVGIPGLIILSQYFPPIKKLLNKIKKTSKYFQKSKEDN